MPSYHEFVIGDSKMEDCGERVYVPVEVGSREDAEKTLSRTKRGRIKSHRVTVPSSQRRRESHDAGLDFPSTARQRERAGIE